MSPPTLSDDTIARAMELHFGAGMCWKTVGRQIGVDYKILEDAVNYAKAHGMTKYRLLNSRRSAL